MKVSFLLFVILREKDVILVEKSFGFLKNLRLYDKNSLCNVKKKMWNKISAKFAFLRRVDFFKFATMLLKFEISAHKKKL